MIVLSFLNTILGLGICTAAVQSWLQFRREQWQRRKEFLEHQLQVYGPAYALISQNRDAFNRIRQIHEVSQQKYSGVIGATEDVEKTFQIANEHIYQVVEENNVKLDKLFNANLHWLDPKDIDLVTQFLHDRNNARVEYAKRGGAKLPPTVAMDLPSISFIRPELIQRFEARFRAKQGELQTLLGARKDDG